MFGLVCILSANGGIEIGGWAMVYWAGPHIWSWERDGALGDFRVEKLSKICIFGNLFIKIQNVIYVRNLTSLVTKIRSKIDVV